MPTPRCGMRVYPRVCGGTSPHICPLTRGTGLSPRVRGNRFGRRSWRRRAGSIPACAGEPSIPGSAGLMVAVYPRVCGGTRHGQRDLLPGRGSIPACAGEPKAWPGSCRVVTVYPRVCGGTAHWPLGISTLKGLSPRVRGNPSARADRRRRAGSIPACAGEPLAGCQQDGRYEVYPRVCGGTVGDVVDDAVVAGLSPRVRGNRRAQQHGQAHRRSIPACAGEPSSRAARHGTSGVYPRVCGGTSGNASFLS